MKMALIILVGFLSFAANAADNEPTSALKCATPAKGCSGNSIDAACSKMECEAKGCNGDYSSGDCKTLKDAHKASCELASSECGESLPSKFKRDRMVPHASPTNMAPTKPSKRGRLKSKEKPLLSNKSVKS